MIRPLKLFSFICALSFFVGSCAPQISLPPTVPVSPTSIATDPVAAQPVLTETSILPEPILKPIVTINPLTGLAVEDPSLLNLPAVLVSVANFPAIARPQSGLSFAPYVFEIYITAGGTRFLATFYGKFPEPEALVTGNCAVRTEPFVQTDNVIGNRVWWDANQNNLQDDWERGVGGVCVNLYDSNSNLLQQTTTDSNGYYGFNVSAGKSYSVNEVLREIEIYFGVKGYQWTHKGKPDPRNYVGLNVNAIREKLGWKAFTPLSEGVQKTIKWWEGQK